MLDRFVETDGNFIDNILSNDKDLNALDLGCGCGACCSAVEKGLSAPHQSQSGTSGQPTFAPQPSFAPDTVAGSTATTSNLSPGQGVVVSIDTLGDHDWYRINLVAGTTYTFRTASDGTNADSFLILRDAAGIELVNDDDSGDGTFSLISYTAATSGVFYLDAGTYNNNTTASFNLTTAATPIGTTDVVGASTATAGTILVGGAVNGNIETASDHDWYAVTLTAGQTYLFRTGVTGAATGDTTDTLLTLRDAAGNQLATNDDSGGLFSAIRFTATTSGTYYLDASAYNTLTGRFNLTAVNSAPLSVFNYDQIANQLTDGYWNGESHHFAVTAGGTITVNFTAIGAAAQILAREALNLWTDVTGITFSEVASGAQITFGDTQTGAFANAVYSGGITTSATVNVGTAWITSNGTALNSYSFQTYVHEIGHVLGLGHGGNYNGEAGYNADALYANDSWATTIMSYFDQQENSYFAAQGFTREFAVSPMTADGVAITSLYGANTLTRTGDTVYGFNNTSGRAIYDSTANPGVAYTIFDNGGIDTLDYSGFTQNQRINLNSETFSNVGTRVGNVSIARGSVIENAIGGSGGDTILGNSSGNTLDGRDGADILYGYAGDDTLTGGTGGDQLFGGIGNDRAVYATASNAVGASALRLANGNYEVRDGSGAVDILRGVEQIQFSNITSTLASVARADVNNDGDSDIIVWSQSTGAISRFDTVNGAASTFSALGNTGSGSWDVRAVGDFNTDGASDVVLKNQASGQFYIWTLTNGVQTGGANLGFIGTNWDVRFAGDFNRDGNSDILWRDSNNGHLYVWTLNSQSAQAGSASLGVIGTNWDSAGVGDFDGDGDSDVLLRNSDNGRLYLYTLQNGQLSGGADLNTFGTQWTVGGIGDFNGDSVSDIALKNTITGQFYILSMNAALSYAGVDMGIIGTDWTIAATGDFNRDSTDDILWRNTATNQAYIWAIENSQQAATGSSSVGTLSADLVIA
jgi:hypothetical protein